MATYLLVVEAVRPVVVRMGASGEIAWGAGWYVYVGSGRRGLAARIARHRRRDKKCRWHIDYLLSREGFVVREVWVGEAAECELAQGLLQRPETRVPGRRAGAGDCRCAAHLMAFGGSLTALQEFCREQGLRPYPES